MDFMADTLYHGRRFRTLNVLDEGVREALTLVIDTSIPGARVVRTLDRLVQWLSKPETILVEIDPENVSEVVAGWCPRPGHPAHLHAARQAESNRPHPTLQSNLAHFPESGVPVHPRILSL